MAHTNDNYLYLMSNLAFSSFLQFNRIKCPKKREEKCSFHGTNYASNYISSKVLALNEILMSWWNNVHDFWQGGALRSEQWRSKVDSLLVVIAVDSFRGGLVSDERSMLQQKEPAATSADLQLAALRALLASFLSYARVRPPFLAQGLELFRRGMMYGNLALIIAFFI